MKSFIPLALLLLAACAAPVAEPPRPALPRPAGCAAIESRDWTAWINRMPGPGARPALHVSGEIDLPTPGFAVTLREGPADRSAVPTQQLILDLAAPNAMVAQVITTQTVRYEGRAIAERYRAIVITCAGQRLAEITDIPDVH